MASSDRSSSASSSPKREKRGKKTAFSSTKKHKKGNQKKKDKKKHKDNSSSPSHSPERQSVKVDKKKIGKQKNKESKKHKVSKDLCDKCKKELPSDGRRIRRFAGKRYHDYCGKQLRKEQTNKEMDQKKAEQNRLWTLLRDAVTALPLAEGLKEVKEVNELLDQLGEQCNLQKEEPYIILDEHEEFPF